MLDHMAQARADLKRRMLEVERKLNPYPLGSSTSNTNYTTKKSSISRNKAQPRPTGSHLDSSNKDEYADADDEDGELPRNPAAPLGRVPRALNQLT